MGPFLDLLVCWSPCLSCCLHGMYGIGYCECLYAQSCPTLCSPLDCSPPGSSVPWNVPSKNTGVGCHFLFQGIFLTRGSNLHLCVFCIHHLASREAPGGCSVFIVNLYQCKSSALFFFKTVLALFGP